jgi:hypothetical protein
VCDDWPNYLARTPGTLRLSVYDSNHSGAARSVIFCSRTPQLGHSTIRVQSCGVNPLPSLSADAVGIVMHLTGTTAPQPPHRVVVELRGIAVALD